MRTIDLNCDMGESFGAWQMGNDAEIMNYVSSINIACGFHAGDATTIRKTVTKALEKQVAIGAHPSFPDLQGFGRREMSLSTQEIFDVVLYQVSSVKGICEALGGKLNHVKPHGALYNQAAKELAVAEGITKAVSAVDSNLILYGLSGSMMIKTASEAGLRTASEVFADRTYQDNGSLTPRSSPDALIDKVETSVSQILKMVESETVVSTNGTEVSIKAETICIHGDGENAVVFAKTISEELIAAGVKIKPI